MCNKITIRFSSGNLLLNTSLLSYCLIIIISRPKNTQYFSAILLKYCAPRLDLQHLLQLQNRKPFSYIFFLLLHCDAVKI